MIDKALKEAVFRELDRQLQHRRHRPSKLRRCKLSLWALCTNRTLSRMVTRNSETVFSPRMPCIIAWLIFGQSLVDTSLSASSEVRTPNELAEKQHPPPHGFGAHLHQDVLHLVLGVAEQPLERRVAAREHLHPRLQRRLRSRRLGPVRACLNT